MEVKIDGVVLGSKRTGWSHWKGGDLTDIVRLSRRNRDYARGTEVFS